jgi:hypothetical protein
MSNLTGQQINQSFQGLLKLADSSTGITTSLQAVQDGLGNDTGLKMGTDYLGGASLVSSVKPLGLKGGTGIATGTGTAFNASSNGMLQSVLFYDRGDIPYSSITFGIGTITTTQDTYDFAIYDAQFCPTAGYQPKDALIPIITVSSADTVTTGFYTYNLTGLTFDKGGYYFMCFRITNPTSVAPTFRFRNPLNSTAASQVASTFLGTVLGYDGTAYTNPFRGGSSQNIGQLHGGNLIGPMQTSYSVEDMEIGVSSTNQSLGGFVLNPVI